LRPITSRQAFVGFLLILLGTAKKVLIADALVSLTVPVAQAAGSGVHISFLEAWGSTVAYALELAFDFSGYSDVAIGSALLLGIRLPVNFDAPYRSKSIVEFWRRWHITLSSFIRDYLYIPMGGNRHGKIRQYLALLLAMTIAGLWHGAGWTFICWGLLHGLLLVINHSWRSVRGYVLPASWIASGWYAAVARLLTIGSLLGTWPFFFAPTMRAATSLLTSMASVSPIALPRQAASFVGSHVFLSFTLQDQLVVPLAGWVTGAAVIFVGIVIVAFAPSTAVLLSRWLGDESGSETEPSVGSSSLPLHPIYAVFLGFLTVSTITMLILHGSPQFLYFTF
jgi:D-alanyl-lipoteichoic acid acyltransferase DltB (MBOAT superfamily)